MASLSILVPVLRRPHRVKPLMDSIRETTPDAKVVFLADPGDLEEHEAVREEGGILIICGGNYGHKINVGAEWSDDMFVFLGADDLKFHPGWLEAAMSKMEEGIGVVGTNDLCNPRVMEGKHATHSLVASWYVERGTIDEPGKVLHEGYPHEWVDNEFVETAQARGAFAFARNSIVEHLHPMVGKAPMDELYEGQQRRMARGRRIFLKRRRLWKRPS